MALFTLALQAKFGHHNSATPEGDPDAEMVAIAGTIIRQRTGNFDPSSYPRPLSGGVNSS